MSGLRGNPQNLRDLARRIRTLPKRVQHAVAERAAPELTGLLTEAFANRRTVYGGARPSSVDGGPLTLVKTGATKASLAFVAIGRIVRVRLSTRYARYLIRYGILPQRDLPVDWAKQLGESARSEIAAQLEGGG